MMGCKDAADTMRHTERKIRKDEKGEQSRQQGGRSLLSIIVIKTIEVMNRGEFAAVQNGDAF